MNKYKQNLRIDGNKIYSYNTHVATIARPNLLVHGHWSMTTSKHVNYVARELGLTKLDTPLAKQTVHEENGKSGLFASVAMVATLASVFTEKPKESNDWKLRMMKAGLESRGLSIPDDWDSLPESVKQERLDKALAVIS